MATSGGATVKPSVPAKPTLGSLLQALAQDSKQNRKLVLNLKTGMFEQKTSPKLAREGLLGLLPSAQGRAGNLQEPQQETTKTREAAIRDPPQGVSRQGTPNVPVVATRDPVADASRDRDVSMASLASSASAASAASATANRGWSSSHSCGSSSRTPSPNPRRVRAPPVLHASVPTTSSIASGTHDPRRPHAAHGAEEPQRQDGLRLTPRPPSAAGMDNMVLRAQNPADHQALRASEKTKKKEKKKKKRSGRGHDVAELGAETVLKPLAKNALVQGESQVVEKSEKREKKRKKERNEKKERATLTQAMISAVRQQDQECNIIPPTEGIALQSAAKMIEQGNPGNAHGLSNFSANVGVEVGKPAADSALEAPQEKVKKDKKTKKEKKAKKQKKHTKGMETSQDKKEVVESATELGTGASRSQGGQGFDPTAFWGCGAGAGSSGASGGPPVTTEPSRSEGPPPATAIREAPTDAVVSPFDVPSGAATVVAAKSGGQEGRHPGKKSRKRSGSSGSTTGAGSPEPGTKRRKDTKRRRRSRSRRRRRRSGVMPPEAWSIWPPPGTHAAPSGPHGAPWGTPPPPGFGWNLTAGSPLPGGSSWATATQTQTCAAQSQEPSGPPTAQQVPSTKVDHPAITSEVAMIRAASSEGQGHATTEEALGKAATRIEGVAEPVAACLERTSNPDDDPMTPSGPPKLDAEKIEAGICHPGAPRLAPVDANDEDPHLDEPSDAVVLACLAAGKPTMASPPPLDPSVKDWPAAAKTGWMAPLRLALDPKMAWTASRRAPQQRERRHDGDTPAAALLDDDEHNKHAEAAGSDKLEVDEPVEPAEPYCAVVVDPYCEGQGLVDDDASLVMPLWGRTLEWTGCLMRVAVDPTTRWSSHQLRGLETRRRMQTRACGKGTELDVEVDPRPNPAAPSAEAADQTAPLHDSVQLAPGQGPVAPNDTGVHLVPWRAPLKLVLPQDVCRDPGRYVGTERRARMAKRSCPLGVAEAAAQVALWGVQGRTSPPPPVAKRVPVVPRVVAANVPVPQPPGYVSYTEGLRATINQLQTDTTPPEIAVRSLWARLSAQDRLRFSSEFPQFMHYVVGVSPTFSKASALATQSPALPGTTTICRPQIPWKPVGTAAPWHRP